MHRLRKLITAACLLSTSLVAAQGYQDHVDRGLHLVQYDSLVLAEQSFREAMKAEPAHRNNALLFRYIGQIQERTNRQLEAIESYTLGINVAENALGIHTTAESPMVDLLIALRLDRASLHLRLGNDDRAISDYSDVLDLRADHTEALFYRAYLYARKRDNRRARQDYDHLLRLQPTHEEALLGLAILNDNDHRPREAMELMDRLIQLHPNHATLYVVRAGMEQERQQYETAIYDFTRAIELEPDNAEHYLSRASCYKVMRRSKLARRDFDKALTLGADRQLVLQMMKQP
ncbi:MAG: tetratricopeptide repeat protein [Bacteroidales bacterium]|nr:tetratricopeptide repeat protein [Candidatus Physcousia equi]